MKTCFVWVCFTTYAMSTMTLADDETSTEAMTTTEEETTGQTTGQTTYTTFTVTTATIFGDTEKVTIQANFNYQTCVLVCACKSSPQCRSGFALAFTNTFASVMRGVFGAFTFTSNCNCPRRLSESSNNESRRLANPQLTVAVDVSVPLGTAETAKTAAQNVPANTIQSNVALGMQSAGATNLIPTSSNAVVASVSSLSGYICYPGKACYFNYYEVGKHYKIANAEAGVTKNACAISCSNDATCEGFESLGQLDGQGVKPSCTFWMNGACDITKGNPDGYVEAGIDYAESCEKTGITRNPYTPVASRNDKGCTLSLPLAMLSAVLMAAVVG